VWSVGACILVVLTGCASRQPYPQTWPVLDDARECEQISGDYRNEGEDDASLPASLTVLLFEAGPNQPGIVRLALSADGALQVSLKSVDDQWSSRVVPREQVACRNGTLIIEAGRWFGAGSQYGLFAVGKRSRAIELHRAAGYLVVKRKMMTSAVIVVVPWKDTTERWHRFARLED
jgi:hypothetical protein